MGLNFSKSRLNRLNKVSNFLQYENLSTRLYCKANKTMSKDNVKKI